MLYAKALTYGGVSESKGDQLSSLPHENGIVNWFSADDVEILNVSKNESLRQSSAVIICLPVNK